MTLRHGGRAFRDAWSRVVTALSVEPSGQLAAAADTLGRVTLVDTRVAPMLIIRLEGPSARRGVGALPSPSWWPRRNPYRPTPTRSPPGSVSYCIRPCAG